MPTPPHWNYLLSLEDDLVHLSRYIEFSPQNFDSYSLELTRILFAAGAEIDVVLKCLCEKLQPKSKADGISKYKEIVLVAYPELLLSVVEVPRYDLKFTPWASWEGSTSPIWWRAYNSVKHHRHTHYSDASLANVLNAVSALFVLLLFYYRDEAMNGSLYPNPELLWAGNPFHVDWPAWGLKVNLYELAAKQKAE